MNMDMGNYTYGTADAVGWHNTTADMENEESVMYTLNNDTVNAAADTSYKQMYSVELLHKIRQICDHHMTNNNGVTLPVCVEYNALFSSLFENSTNGINNSEVTTADDRAFVSERFDGRFIPYTILCVVASLFNVISIAALVKIREHWACHHLLLVNLAVCDICGAILLWMYHNSPALFPHFTVSTLSHCLFISVVLVAPFIMTLCNSSCNLLMLALNLYLAICHPLVAATKLSKNVIRVLISVTWLCSIGLSCVPLVIMLYRNQRESCRSFVVDMAVKALQICAYVLVSIILLAIAFYARIYLVILRYRKSTRGLNRNIHHTGSRDRNYKAFLTTLLLAGTLFIFWLPYMVFHFMTAHLEIENIPDIVLNVKFYFIDFLPMLHFLSDPAIYGLRILEIRRGYRRLFCRRRHRHTIQEPHSSMETRSTLVRSSVISVEATQM